MRNKLGLKPVQTQPRVMLRDIVTSDLPTADSLTFPFGHADAIEPEMFMNDTLGDCAIAGSIEEVRLANALRGVTVNFTDDTAELNYHAIAGYTPGDPSSDQGTDVHDLYESRKATGLLDADGNYHKIVAYAGLTPGNFDELLVALSLFDMVGIGINVPDYADTQFESGQPWDLLPGRHSIAGGHYIPVVGTQSRQLADVFTWGRKQSITARFYTALNTVAVVALTEELFADGKTPEGIDRDKLAAFLPELGTGTVLSKAPRSKPRPEQRATKGEHVLTSDDVSRIAGEIV